MSVAIAMVTGTALLLTGCGSSSATPSTSTPSSSTPTAGGVINFAESPATQLNWFLPIVPSSNDTVNNDQLVVQLYKPMLWLNNNYSINWNSSIAKNITYNKAGTVYHIFLHKKWLWSNGQPVTSKDVLFSWNVIKAASSPNAPKPWPFVGAGTGEIPNGIQSVVANGNYEVTITLKKPANQQWFIYNGIIQLTPMPAAVWDIHKNMTKELTYLGENGANLMFDKVTDGPFVPVSATPSQSWVIAPNKNYPGHKSLVKKIVFDYEASSTAEFAALKTNQVNLGYLDPSQLGSAPALTSQGDKITSAYPFGIFWTEMNMYKGSPYASIFDHLYVRQALQMGLDNATIAKDIFKGYATPVDGPIPTVPATKYLDPSLATNPYPYNIQAAMQLLEKHGWKEVNGVMTKGSQQMKFPMIYVSGATSSTDAAELMQSDWAKMGVDVTLAGEPFANFISMTSDSTNHTWALANGSGWDYNGPGFYPTGGQLFATGAPSGTGFSNQEEDALIKATHQPYPTEQQTMSVFFKYEDYTAKILPFLWNENYAAIGVNAPNVHNTVKYADAATSLPQMQYWWVSSGN